MSKPQYQDVNHSNLESHIAEANHAPRIISWNTTLKCNLRCSHCYINAKNDPDKSELNQYEGKMLIDQISDLGKSILVLSGGEPLLRNDIFELARYGVQKGLIVTMGTNGTLLDDEAAKKLYEVGIRKVAISIDSSTSDVHDELRGVNGAWNKALDGVRACLRNGVGVQFNVTMTKQNHSDLDNILLLAKNLCVRSTHLFFLVPTGRGKDLKDITPADYEGLLRKMLSYPQNELEIKPTCAPQFMRIAKELNVNTNRWGRGCIAGISYCRILPNGSVTPCPYLPTEVGNIRKTPLQEIWMKSEVLKALRNFENLKGKCGICEYQDICGGCRARAYGLTSYCSGATAKSEEQTNAGDIFASDPWCTYQPQAS